MPGVGFWDTAEFQTVPPILGTAHPTGYPTYVLLGWLASLVLTPFGEAAFRMNLLSAILVGVAAAITVDLVRLLTRSVVLGVVAGLGLAATPIVWAIGTHADPHALHLASSPRSCGCWSAGSRRARADPVASATAGSWPRPSSTGLSVGNHSLTLLLAVPIVLYVLAVEPRILLRWRFVARLRRGRRHPDGPRLPRAAAPGRALRAPRAPPRLRHARTPGTGSSTSSSASSSGAGSATRSANLPGKVADLADLASRELGPLAFLVAIGFLVTAIRRPPYALLTGSALLITCFFNAAYINADIERYYLGRRSSPGRGWRSSPGRGVDLVAAGLGDVERRRRANRRPTPRRAADASSRCAWPRWRRRASCCSRRPRRPSRSRAAGRPDRTTRAPPSGSTPSWLRSSRTR